MRSLHDFDREILRPRLINVLRGPRLPADEDATSKTNSNGPRSTLFELNVAAILRDAGLQPELAVHPDVRCRVGDTPLFFECKRPISEARVAKRITEAGQQLQADLAAYASVDACGIIVLSLAKLFSPSQTPFPINTQRAAQDFLNGWLGAIVVDTERAWRPLVGAGRLIGILFHVAAVFVNEAKGRFDLGQWWIGLPLTEHPGVHPAYARLGEVLQASADLS
ncbi:MAG: hypothetical protein NTW68_00310 [candidate division NC10 bacterium]|nr:hypothetical protein [candidate division NC10 bacterium]